MKKMLTDAEEVVLTMQKIAADMELTTYDKIYDFVYAKDPVNCPSHTTISRIFKKGAEKEADSFSFVKTLKPVYNALLDVDIDKDDDTIEDLGYKSLLRYKGDLLADYQKRNAELKEENDAIKDREKAKYAEKLSQETKHFNDSIAFTMNQITLKDQRIDALLAYTKELLDTTKELMATNNKLVNQLMNCPYTKNGIKDEN